MEAKQTVRALLSTCFLTSAAAADPTFRTIALSGSAAPGLPAGTTLNFLSDPRIINTGRVAFWADLAGPGVGGTNDGSIWSDRSGGLTMLYREGDAAPSGGTTVWATLGRPAFNATGQVGLIGCLVDPALPNMPTNLAVAAEDPGMALQKVARDGETQPTPSGLPWDSMSQPTLNDAGRVGLTARGGQNLWSTLPGQPLSMVTSMQLQAPGAGGLLFDILDPGTPNASGSVLFRSSLRDSFNPALGTGLWLSGSGGIAAVAVGGAAAPGLSGTFAEFAIHPALNSQEHVAFWARATGAAITAQNDEGYWVGPATSPTLWVREGDQAHGCPAGTFYADLPRHAAWSDSGVLAFSARLAGASLTTTDNGGVWAATGASQVRLLAREGAQAPRLPLGVVFASLDEPIVNDAGQVTFTAWLKGKGVTPATNRVLYATDRAGVLGVVVRTGDSFDVGAGPARIVDEILFDSEARQTGHSQFAVTPAAAGATGSMVLKLGFKDPAAPPASALSSGLFVASVGCLVDLDSSGTVTVVDYILFMNAFAAGNLRACDFSGNGVLDVNDYVLFQTAAAAGCL